ncbi:MAG: hypothetical protein ACLFVJ_20465 [Persicimonas sp.]
MTSYQEGDSTTARDPGDGLGCLVPLIGLTISLAIAISLISWFWVDLQDDEAEPADASVVDAGDASSAASAAVDATAAELAPSKVSSEVLVEVVQSVGWRSFGQPDVYDLGSQQRVAHKFHRDDQKIRLIVHTHKSTEASESAIDTIDSPAQAIQFGSKMVVVEPVGRDARPAIGSVTDRLRQFRDLIDGQSDQPATSQ